MALGCSTTCPIVVAIALTSPQLLGHRSSSFTPAWLAGILTPDLTWFKGGWSLALIHRYSNLSPGRSYFAFIIRNVVTIVSGSHYGNRSNHFSSKLFKCWLVRNTTLATALF